MERDPIWFEKILGIIPGYKGYRDRDAVRETDAVLRREVATKLDAYKLRLNDVINERTQAGDLGVLDALGQAQTRLGRVADTLRTAARGASGWLDDYQVNEAVLNQIHAADQGLVQGLATLEEAFDAAKDAADPAPLLDTIREIVAQLDDHLASRDRLLTGAPDLSTPSEE